MFTFFHKEFQKPFSRQILIIAVLFLSALGVCMMSPSNPFSNSLPATDSAVFLSFAQAMQAGKIPYLDFFDNKGPFLFFINYAGYLFGGMRGVWCLELLFLFVAAIFAYKTTRLLFGRFVSLLALVAAYILFTTFYSLGNLAEVYAQPFIQISLYLFSRHLLGKGNLRPMEILITGFCFGLVLMLKPNLFAVWVVFGGMVAFLSNIKTTLLRLAGLFLLGAVVGVAPFLIYLVVHGAFGACLEQYILFNSMYARNNQNLSMYFDNFFGTLNKVYTWGLFAAAVFWLGTKWKSREYPFYIAYFFSVLLAVVLISYSSFNFGYYNMILIPLFTPAVAFFANCLLQSGLREKVGKVPAWISILVIFCFALNLPIFYGVGGIYLRIFPRNVSHVRLLKPDVERISKIIQTHTTPAEAISVVGNTCNIYFYSNRLSASKYLYQFPVSDVSAKVAEEYQQEILVSKPRLILFPPLYSGGEVDGQLMRRFQKKFPRIFELLDSEYIRIHADSGAAIIYKRKI
jgi:hypothetical protein